MPRQFGVPLGLLAALALAAIAGCGTPVQVTRFHSLPPVPSGLTVELRPAEPDKADSLEFRHYAKLAGDLLAQAGYPPPPGKPADLIGRLGWRILGARTEQIATPIYGPVGPGSFVRRLGPDGKPVAVYVPPPQGVVDMAYETRVLHDVMATLELADATTSQTRYEGRATAASFTPDVAPVMPALLRGMLAQFPGASGTTVVVRVDE